jgi:hypothetical protein
MDQIVYNESLQTDSVSQPFIERQYVECFDSNNGIYTSNQIVISTSALTFSGRWLDYANAYFRFPIVMAIYKTEASTNFGAGSYSNYAMALKNSFTHIIHSVDCKLNGSSITSIASFQNMWYHFKEIQSMNVADLQHLPSTNFYPDSAFSWTYKANTSVDGQGVCNNRPFSCLISRLKNYDSANVSAGDFPTANTISGGFASNYVGVMHPIIADSIQTGGNDGMLMRAKQYAFNPKASVYSALLDTDATTQVWKNYFYKYPTDDNVATKTALVWQITAIIPLKSVCQFFENAPLLRSTKLDLILNINQGSVNLTGTGVAETDDSPRKLTWVQTNASTSYGTVPFIVSSGDIDQPNAELISDTGAKTFTAGLGIVSLRCGGIVNETITHSSKNCSLVVPSYALNSASETEYLSLSGGKKTIYYRDMTSYVLTNQSGTIQPLLTTSAVRPLSISIFPFITASSNGDIGVSQLLSAFDTAPATYAPLFEAYDTQIIVSGTNLWQNSMNYNYQNFVQEISQFSTLNGNSISALGSGLITQTMWEQTYGVIVADLSRRVADSTPKSISFKMTIKSKKAVDLYCFVEVLKSLTIDLQTGNVLSLE